MSADATHDLTITELCDLFLAQHEASPARLELLRAMLRHACISFGALPVSELGPLEIARWRAALPTPTRWQATQAFAQATRWAHAWGLVDADPFANVRNPRPQRTEHAPFASWDQLESVAQELPHALQLLPLLGAGCGLRPGELLGLAWDCIDPARRELVVRRSVWRGELRDTLKTTRSRRVVPLRSRLVERIDEFTPADRTGLVFASRAGGPVDLHNLRARAWKPALRRAGIEHPHRLYDLRHTYATWSLRAGVSIFQLARRMGTSVDLIDSTYGHLAADAADHERALLDLWDQA